MLVCSLMCISSHCGHKLPQLTWTAKALLQTTEDIEFGVEQIISYLPLSHIAAQVSYSLS